MTPARAEKRGLERKMLDTRWLSTKVLDTNKKPEDLALILGTHVWKQRANSYKLSSGLHINIKMF